MTAVTITSTKRQGSSCFTSDLCKIIFCSFWAKFSDTDFSSSCKIIHFKKSDNQLLKRHLTHYWTSPLTPFWLSASRMLMPQSMCAIIQILTRTVMKYHISVDCQESYIFPRENITLLAPPAHDISFVPVDICYIRWSKWMISWKFYVLYDYHKVW